MQGDNLRAGESDGRREARNEMLPADRNYKDTTPALLHPVLDGIAQDPSQRQ